MAPKRAAASAKKYFDDDDEVVQVLEVKQEKALPVKVKEQKALPIQKKSGILKKVKEVDTKHPMSSFHLWLQEDKNREQVEQYKLKRSNFLEKAGSYWRNQVDDDVKEVYANKFKIAKELWEKQHGQ